MSRTDGLLRILCWSCGACVLLLLPNALWAQQMPLFTNYVFQPLAYNPAYAGSKDFFSSHLVYRHQWANLEGAPRTFGLGLHSPLRNNRLGLGLQLLQDEIGPTQRTTVDLSYAYRLRFKKSSLAAGLQVGFKSIRADFRDLQLANAVDGAFFDLQPSWLLPNVGVGIYFLHPQFYVGFGCPSVVEYELNTAPVLDQYSKEVRHFYFHGGGIIALNRDLKFKPAFILRTIGWSEGRAVLNGSAPPIVAPTELDLDLSLLLQEVLWVGVSFRTALEILGKNTGSTDSADLWLAWYAPRGIRVGLSYDFTISPLAATTFGALEMMFGYEFNFRKKRRVTPRYF